MKQVDSNDSQQALELFLVRMAGKYSKYLPGQQIFAEGDHGKTMLLLLNGTVKISKLLPDKSKEVTIATRNEGEFIGEMALVEESPRSATVTAETDCEVLEFTKDNFEKIIKEQPALATRVLKSLSNKLRESDSSRIAELEESNRELAESNKKLTGMNEFLDCIIERSPSAIILINRLGEIIRMNKSAFRMFGKKSLKECRKLNDLFVDLKFLEKRNQLLENRNHEFMGRRGYQDFPALISLASLSEFNGEKLYLVICQDLSELRGINAAGLDLERFAVSQQTAAELVNIVYDETLDIINASEILVNRLDQKNRKKLAEPVLDLIKKNTRFKELVRKYEALHAASDYYSYVDFRVIMRTIVKYFQSKDTYRNLPMKLDFDSDFPQRMHIKESPIRNAMMSLVYFIAEKVQDNEDIFDKTISLRLSRSEDGHYALVKFHVDGPCFSAEQIRALHGFPENTGPELPRTGLVSPWTIIEEHSGSIEASYDPEKGTRITIRLPLHPIKNND